MILDDKIIMFPPPPPYLQSPPSPSSSSAHFSARPHATLTSLPSHILLQIIHHTFPPLTSPSHTPLPSSPHQYQQLYQDTKPERQRKTLFWLSTALRLVSRQLYTACMHVLRSTYLPSYSLLVRPPYTSDPFPLSLPTSASTTSGATAPQESAAAVAAAAPPAYSSSRSTTSLTSLAHAQPQDTPSPLLTIHRETPVLDRFIALKVRQDVFADDTELHTDREDAFRDLFDVAQPRARLEDLVRVYGVREGVVSVPGTGGGGGAARPGQGQGREEREGQGRVYTSTSQNSSLISLPSPKSPPPPPFSPSSSSHPTPVPAPAHTVKPRRSIFSFMKGAPSSPTTAAAAAAAQNSRPLPPPPRQPQPHIQPMPFSALSVSFSPRRVGLVLNRSRTIAEVPRLGMGRNKEPLEALARALVRELRVALGG